MADPFKPGTRADGSTYYWFHISAGHQPSGGRLQVYRPRDTKKELKAEYARVLSAINEKRFVARDGVTVNGYLDQWESAYCRDLEEG